MFSTSSSKLYPVRLRFSRLRVVEELYYEQSNHPEEFGRASVLNNKQEKVDALKRSSLLQTAVSKILRAVLFCFILFGYLVLVFDFDFFIDFVKKFDEELSLIRISELCE